MDKASLQQHPLWGEITQRIESWRSEGPRSNTGWEQARERAQQVGEYLLALKPMMVASAGLFSNPMLENARSQWSSASVSYDTEGNYPSVDGYLDCVIDVVGRWPLVKGQVNAARAVTEIYSGAATRAQRDVEQLADAAVAARQKTSDLQTQLDALESKTVDLETYIDQLSATAHALQSEREKEVISERREMESTFRKWLEGVRFEQIQERDSLLGEHDALTEKGKLWLDEVRSLREQVGNVVDATTSEQMSKSYSNEANREFILAGRSYSSGVILLVILAAFLWFAMQELGPSGGATWQFMSLKVGVSAALATGATILFRLGHQFLASSRQHRKMAMELVAMIPFLQGLEEDERGTLREAKLDFFRRAFGQTDRGVEESGGQDPTGVISNMAQALVDLSRKVTSGA